MICLRCKQKDVEVGSSKLWCRDCRKLASVAAHNFKSTHPKCLYSGFSYQSREIHLKEIGFGSYQAYLKSDLWKKVRSAVYKAKGDRCFRCSEKAEVIHHTRYHKNDLLGKTLLFLFPVCSKCHEYIEFSKKGKKVDVNTANCRFGAKRRWNEPQDPLSKLILTLDAT